MIEAKKIINYLQDNLDSDPAFSEEIFERIIAKHEVDPDWVQEIRDGEVTTDEYDAYLEHVETASVTPSIEEAAIRSLIFQLRDELKEEIENNSGDLDF